ncbi:hypothetical protein CCACVL1_18258 [Corchorus capsularis]|uniref:Uncharacterized protein n=1 Tax=Corchorus capsularis TaxID=210143 RepID=A0A1R3HLV6_COCAP|nr:hypothetical protein CCACVL1_18258 [Corchorus capsularis]
MAVSPEHKMSSVKPPRPRLQAENASSTFGFHRSRVLSDSRNQNGRANELEMR